MKVLSLGAGVQSSTVLLMSCRGVLPQLDAAVFADTGWESKVVYEHLDWLTEEASRYGIPVYRVSAGSLRVDAIASAVRDGKRYASMPLYTRTEDGKIGRIRRQCTREYKRDPIDRFIRRELLGCAPGRTAPPGSCDIWLGISADEMRRVRFSEVRWKRHIYPLLGLPTDARYLSDLYSRKDCLAWVRETYGRDIPRSSCIGCPNHSRAEWEAIRARPEEWSDVCEVDEAIRHTGGMRGEVFLHRSATPLRTIDFAYSETLEIAFSEYRECDSNCFT